LVFDLVLFLKKDANLTKQIKNRATKHIIYKFDAFF